MRDAAPQPKAYLRPGASNVNTTIPGDVVAAQALTRLGTNATISFLANQPTDLVVDH